MESDALFTESPRGPTGRPLPVALAVSLSAHLALVVWLGMILRSDSAHSNISAPVTLEIALVQPDSERESGQDAAPAVEQSDVLEPSPRVARRSLSDATGPATGPDAAVDLPEITAEPNEIEALEPVPVATAPITEVRILARIRQVPALDLRVRRQLVPGQKEMLDERLKEWEQDIHQLVAKGGTVSWRDGEQQYNASVTHVPASNSTDFERAIVEVRTELDGVEMATELMLRRMAFSHFAQLVDRWDSEVAVSKDVIEGRFHSNSKLFVSPGRRADARFDGKVTVASTIRMSGRSRRSEIFPRGVETRVRKIPLPGNVLALDNLMVDSAENVHLIPADATIVFQPGGGIRWATRKVPEREFHESGSDAPLYLIGTNEAEFAVSGTVNGAVIVYTDGKISIVGNLVYEHHPEQHPDSADYLGLISEGNVEIAPPRVTGHGDLTVHAAIYARRRFAVRGYHVRNRGLLTIYGSVTAGSLSATEPRFATRLRFDRRLETRRPPGFPMTDRYELESWDQRWVASGP